MSNGLARAKYVIGMSQEEGLISHWGIHSQLYMHFTSPIRRYADDICHRMLTACLELEAAIPNIEEYRKQPIYQYIPHELVIRPGPDGKNVSIYSYNQALPPADLLKLCDKMYPIGQSNAQSDIEKASKKSH